MKAADQTLVELVGTTSKPIGTRAIKANLMCWMPNGMPIIELRPAKTGFLSADTRSERLCPGLGLCPYSRAISLCFPESP